jgi:hypothetical protein
MNVIIVRISDGRTFVHIRKHSFVKEYFHARRLGSCLIQVRLIEDVIKYREFLLDTRSNLCLWINSST